MRIVINLLGSITYTKCFCKPASQEMGRREDVNPRRIILSTTFLIYGLNGKN
jgi:hypothetical protein